MKKMLKKIITLFLLANMMILSSSPILAGEKGDIETSLITNLIYDSKDSDFLKIEKIIEKKVNTYTYYIPYESNSDVITITYYNDLDKERITQTLKVYTKKTVSGISAQEKEVINYTIEDNPELSSFIITVPLTSDIKTGQKNESIVRYETDAFFRKLGEITVIRFPSYTVEDGKMPAFIEKGTTTNKNNYINNIYVNKAITDAVKVSSKNTKVTDTAGYNVYTLQNEDVFTKSNHYVLFGDKQMLRFKIEQVALKSDNFTPTQLSNIYSALSKNVYKIMVPRDTSQISQELNYKSINPAPKNTENTKDGNTILNIETSANKTQTITIEGYIKMEFKNDDYSLIDSMPLEDYYDKVKIDGSLGSYLQEDKQYWQTSNDKIQKIALDLKNKSTTIGQLIYNTYDYTTTNLSYSYDKANNKIPNNRQGAYKVLFENAPSVCMEYSDVLTTLLRANGVPTRTVAGYTLDDDQTTIDEEGDRITHEWIEAWIPDFGWLALDATWGSPDNRYIGYILDRIILYTTSSLSDKNNSTISVYTADKKFKYGDYKFDIELLNEEDYYQAIGDSTTAQQIIEQNKQFEIDLEKYKNLEEEDKEAAFYIMDKIDTLIKTSIIGRVFLISLPLLALILLISLISSVIRWMFGKNKPSKLIEQKPELKKKPKKLTK